MRRITYILSFVLVLLVGCRADFNWDYEVLNDYQKAFIDRFGWPESRQNWNTTKSFKVAITDEAGGVGTVKVLSANPLEDTKRSYVLGKYLAVMDDGLTVTCEGPYTLQNIFVSIEKDGTYAIKGADCKDKDEVAIDFEADDFKPLSDEVDDKSVSDILSSVSKMSYIFGFEVNDTVRDNIDFNDVVLEVVHASGEDVVDVKLRAVGAKEQMSVIYDSPEGKVTLFDDVHYAFGYHNTHILINVDSVSHNYRSPKVYYNLHVGNDFSILEDAHRFVVMAHPTEKGDTVGAYNIKPNKPENWGIPTYCIVAASPKYDWVSEEYLIEEDPKLRTFPAWVKNYRLYNVWWDTLWDPRELALMKDGKTYCPAFEYEDIIFDAKDMEKNGGLKVDSISFSYLEPYEDERIGVNLAFVVLGRNEGRIRIELERSDGGEFEWFGKTAYVDVYDKDVNVDAGIGCYAEACHILITRKTFKEIIENRAYIKVRFNRGDTETKINSVWIREQ